MTQQITEVIDLDDLLRESMQKGKKLPKPTAILPPDDDLESLLSQSLAIRDEAVDYSSNREKLKKQNLRTEEREAIESKVREWEARNIWQTVAVVAVFERVTCSCGYYSEAFSHMMHRQIHKHQRATTRLIADDNIPADIPRMVARQHSEVEICAECAGEKGWDLENAEELEWQAPTFK